MNFCSEGPPSGICIAIQPLTKTIVIIDRIASFFIVIVIIIFNKVL